MSLLETLKTFDLPYPSVAEADKRLIIKSILYLKAPDLAKALIQRSDIEEYLFARVQVVPLIISDAEYSNTVIYKISYYDVPWAFYRQTAWRKSDKVIDQAIVISNEIFSLVCSMVNNKQTVYSIDLDGEEQAVDLLNFEPLAWLDPETLIVKEKPWPKIAVFKESMGKSLYLIKTGQPEIWLVYHSDGCSLWFENIGDATELFERMIDERVLEYQLSEEQQLSIQTDNTTIYLQKSPVKEWGRFICYEITGEHKQVIAQDNQAIVDFFAYQNKMVWDKLSSLPNSF